MIKKVLIEAVETKAMRVLKKTIIRTMIGALIVLPTSGYVAQAASQHGVVQETDVKSSIDDLFSGEKSLFLPTEQPNIDAPVAYLINANTGQVLFDDDGDYEMDILSVSKILSAYVILDEMKQAPEKYNWDTRIRATGSVVAVSYDPNFSNIELERDAEYTIRELFEAMMIKSSNAATMLLGREFFGDEKAYVAKMREKASELNLKHTTMKTSTGLNKADLKDYGYTDLEEGNNQMSAEDVAFLTMQIIRDYPTILDVTRKPRSTFGSLTSEPVTYEATNWLLPGFEHGYDGVSGFKTGADLMEYTSNIVFTAERDGVALIGVILGARNAATRSEGAISLMEYGFARLIHKPLITEESQLFDDGTVKLKYAGSNRLPVTVAHDFTLSTSYSDLTPEYVFVPTNKKYNPKYDAFEGSIQKGEVLGYITVEYEDLAFLSADTEEHYSVDVIAASDVGNGFFLFNFIESIIDAVQG
jgi:D-alanyl-D-alanine carboxypeptidase (penicillin-binding protein 5/6)